jgi:hypothetical protein
MAKPRKRRSPVDRIMDGMRRCARSHRMACRGEVVHQEFLRRWAAVDQEERRFRRLVQRVLREARKGATHG